MVDVYMPEVEFAVGNISPQNGEKLCYVIPVAHGCEFPTIKAMLKVYSESEMEAHEYSRFVLYVGWIPVFGGEAKEMPSTEAAWKRLWDQMKTKVITEDSRHAFTPTDDDLSTGDVDTASAWQPGLVNLGQFSNQLDATLLAPASKHRLGFWEKHAYRTGNTDKTRGMKDVVVDIQGGGRATYPGGILFLVGNPVNWAGGPFAQMFPGDLEYATLRSFQAPAYDPVLDWGNSGKATQEDIRQYMSRRYEDLPAASSARAAVGGSNPQPAIPALPKALVRQRQVTIGVDCVMQTTQMSVRDQAHYIKSGSAK